MFLKLCFTRISWVK